MTQADIDQEYRDCLFIGQTECGYYGNNRYRPFFLLALLKTINPEKPTKEWQIINATRGRKAGYMFEEALEVYDDAVAGTFGPCSVVAMLSVSWAHWHEHSKSPLVMWYVCGLCFCDSDKAGENQQMVYGQRDNLRNAVDKFFLAVLDNPNAAVPEPQPEHAPELGGESGGA